MNQVKEFHKLVQLFIKSFDQNQKGPQLRRAPDEKISNGTVSVELLRHESNDVERQIPFDLLLDWETIFEHDLRDVKIHTGAYSDELTSNAGAQALTIGNDIYFADGKFSPDTEEGKILLGHELMHVVQKDNNRAMKYVEDIDTLEQEAAQVERMVSGVELHGVSGFRWAGEREDDIEIDLSRMSLEELSDRNTKKGTRILLKSGEEVFLTESEYEWVLEEAEKKLKQYYADLATEDERINFMKVIHRSR